MNELKTFGETSLIDVKPKKTPTAKWSLNEFELIGPNIMTVSLLHNGPEYGNSGRGPVVKIKFKNNACTDMYLNGQEADEFVIEFRGNSERDQLISVLDLIVKELKK